MEFRRFQSTIRLMSGILLTISMASCHYNESFKGYTFVLPEADVLDQSNKRSLMMLNFSGAQRWCKENVARSTLAAIPNKDVQRDLTLFIENAIKANENMNINLRRDINNIRVNGKYHITDGWRWLNGHEERQLSSNSIGSTYAILWGGHQNAAFTSDHPRTSYFYICEDPGISIRCNAFPKNGRCYRTRYRKSTWYDARNDCLDKGGDLASLENFQRDEIKSFATFISLNSSFYWIGMQKNAWLWEDTGSAIRYSYWDRGYPDENKGDCVCLSNKSHGGWLWKECNCNVPYLFICMINDTSDSSTLTHSNESVSTEFIIMTVSCAAIFVVIIIISAVLIIRKRREKDEQKRDFESRSAEGSKSFGYEAPNHAMESSTDPPVYEEIQEPKRTYCASDATYASVEMTSTAEDKHPVNNIVYAELDLTSTA